MKRNRFVGILSVTMICAFLLQALPVNAGTKAVDIYVMDVLDGNTIRVDLGGRLKTVRVIGLNTPTKPAPRKAGQCFNAQAHKQAKKLLLGKKVTLEEDVTQGDVNRDDYLLRHVYLTGGISFANLMIRDGYGFAFNPKKPFYNQRALLKSELAAKTAKKGLWAVATCNGKTKK